MKMAFSSDSFSAMAAGKEVETDRIIDFFPPVPVAIQSVQELLYMMCFDVPAAFFSHAPKCLLVDCTCSYSIALVIFLSYSTVVQYITSSSPLSLSLSLER
jgi:hypothetical protein